MPLNEQALKKELSLRQPKSLYLLYGDEPLLLTAWRRRVAELLTDGDLQRLERIDGQGLDVDALWESSQLLPMLGARRVLCVENFEPELLLDADCKELCALFGELPESTALLLTGRENAFDLKAGPRAKKLVAAAEKAGVVACLNHRSVSDAKTWLRARCQQRQCELDPAAAAFLIERCGEEMGALANECDKLCAYVGPGQAIGRDVIARVCSPSLEGDVYALSRLLLRGEAGPLLSEIDMLLRLRQPVALLLSNLGAAMADLTRACAARAANKSAAQMAKELHYRFEWRASNAFRDSARLDARRLLTVCGILCDAELALKSTGADERILLETAVIRSLRALRGEPC